MIFLARVPCRLRQSEVRDPTGRSRSSANFQCVSATLRLRAILPAILIAVIHNAAPPEVADADVAIGLHICFVEVHARAEFLTTGDLVFRLVVGGLGAFYGFI